MDLHTDPIMLQRGADSLNVLAAQLACVADRLDRLGLDGPRSRAGGAADRRAALIAALRADATELSGCETLLRADRTDLLAGEVSVLEQMTDLDRRLSESSGRVR